MTRFIGGLAPPDGVPLETEGEDPSLGLMVVELSTRWQVGAASSSFGSAERSRLPFPGP